MAFTSEQLEAINKEGENIIVSAGAGSGKTAVLTERVIRKLNDGVPIDHILVLTFTNEAAGEMKSRIRSSIIKNNLTKQLTLLDSAYITTFDSFAFSIVKKYHYLLNINPNVKIIDSSVIRIKKLHFLEDILMKKYDSNNESFINLINTFCVKDDLSIKNYLLNISDKIDLLLDKETYLNNYNELFYSDDFINKSVSKFENIIIKKIDELKEIYEDFIYYINDNLKDKLDVYLKILFENKDYSSLHEFINIKGIRFVGVNEEGLTLKEELKDKIEEIKKYLKYNSQDEIKEEILSTKKNVNEFISIIKELDRRVTEYKKEYDIYEFNDIAKLAIKVVKDNANVREELTEYFNEIMVDEYQDTSIIQEEFISLISNNNVYMVGDIKQSIYRFRNANPYIFQEKYNKYSSHNGGYKIDLLKNFRSRKETLEVINEIFNLIMDDKIGNAKYKESHNMEYGNIDYDKEDTKANNYLEIYNYDSEDDTYKDFEKELFIIADDIKEKIKNKYLVFDKETKKLRPITYSDICIITDRNKYLDKYKKILEWNNIPSSLYKDEELTNDTDILVIKNLINLIILVNKKEKNEKLNYLYTSVARSYLFSYSDDEIYKVITNKKIYDDQIIKKCMKIDLNLPICSIINNILEEFDVYEKLTALNNIESSLVRIDNFLNIASSLSDLSYTLEDFITYFDETIEMNLSIKYSINTKGSNSIKIMNIHKSKGLEFSLCYFTGMQNKFAKKEIKEKILFKEEYGLIFPNKGLEDTILKDIYIDNYYEEEISEKIRLFYVALTRCREKMIIVTSLDNDKTKYNTLVPYSKRIKYTSFNDILNSINAVNKYVVNKEANYTHDYENFKSISFEETKNDIKVEKRYNDINYVIEDNKQFSKASKKLFTNEEIAKTEYGEKIHESLEYANILDISNPYLKNLFNILDKNYQNIYREYEFIYRENNEKYHGIIDLMLEYENKFIIVDYKLKNITDSEYVKQLTGYSKYIKSKTNKQVQTYLYSLMNNELKEIDINL